MNVVQVTTVDTEVEAQPGDAEAAVDLVDALADVSTLEDQADLAMDQEQYQRVLRKYASILERVTVLEGSSTS